MQRAKARQLAGAIQELYTTLFIEDSGLIAMRLDRNEPPTVQLNGFKAVLNLGQQPLQIRKMNKSAMFPETWYEVSVVLGGVRWLACGRPDELAEVGLAYSESDPHFFPEPGVPAPGPEM